MRLRRWASRCYDLREGDVVAEHRHFFRWSAAHLARLDNARIQRKARHRGRFETRVEKA